MVRSSRSTKADTTVSVLTPDAVAEGYAAWLHGVLDGEGQA